MSWPVAFRAGLERRGVRTEVGNPSRSSNADLAVVWGWRQHDVIQPMMESGRHVIVMERGFIQPRRAWCSLALDGLNGRGRFPDPKDDGLRWQKYFSHHLKPWQAAGEYALVVGQVPGDAALAGCDIEVWAATQTRRLLEMGWRVVYRPHPLHATPCPVGATLSSNSLDVDLARADRVVTFSSTTAVEAILKGVPTVVTDPGSVAYPVASHRVEEPLRRPDRTAWCHALAWKQWTIDELADGYAWTQFKSVLEGSA